MQYSIHRASCPLGAPDTDWESPRWADAETLNVNNFAWKDSGHRPLTRARVVYDNDFLGVIFRVEDHYVRAVAQRFQDNVCTDSCVEFFVAPLPDSDAYFNFEVNCGGTMLLRRCASTAERDSGGTTKSVGEADGRTIHMATTLPKVVDPEITESTTWLVEYHIPLALFAAYFTQPNAASGSIWRGNFYKCGDKTSHPHWGTWAPINTPSPNFHCPEYFKPLIFV